MEWHLDYLRLRLNLRFSLKHSYFSDASWKYSHGCLQSVNQAFNTEPNVQRFFFFFFGGLFLVLKKGHLSCHAGLSKTVIWSQASKQVSFKNSISYATTVSPNSTVNSTWHSGILFCSHPHTGLSLEIETTYVTLQVLSVPISRVTRLLLWWRTTLSLWDRNRANVLR